MTPKEKAEELVDKFHIIETSHWNENMDGRMTMEQIGFYSAKQCALIAVDEILWEIIKYADNSQQYVIENSEFWKQVKQEIEKL
jgi:hypothetical protein